MWWIFGTLFGMGVAPEFVDSIIPTWLTFILLLIVPTTLVLGAVGVEETKGKQLSALMIFACALLGILLVYYLEAAFCGLFFADELY